MLNQQKPNYSLLKCKSLIIIILLGQNFDLQAYKPFKDVSTIVKKLKGKTSRKIQEEFPVLRKKYWGRHFWTIGFGCWSTGNITDMMVNDYLEHYRKLTNDNDDFILE